MIDKIGLYCSVILFICLLALLSYCKVLKSDLNSAQMALAIEKANANELKETINNQNEAINALKVLDNEVSAEYSKVGEIFKPYATIKVESCEQKINAINDILREFSKNNAIISQ